jgi:hypothetical protein
MTEHSDTTLKARALARIRAGEMTTAEAAYVYELDRVSLWRWCKAARIDPARARLEWLVRERQGQNHKPAPRPGSKARQRQALAAAAANTDPQRLAAFAPKIKRKRPDSGC